MQHSDYKSGRKYDETDSKADQERQEAHGNEARKEDLARSTEAADYAVVASAARQRAAHPQPSGPLITGEKHGDKSKGSEEGQETG
jgi:hypothetical protein